MTALDREYTSYFLAKGRGERREIFIPSPAFKRRLRSYLPELNRVQKERDVFSVAYGFVRGRGCVSHARRHVGFNYTASFDIRNFFDSVQADHVQDALPSTLLDDCFITGAPRQGLPTSPAISNIAFSECDNELVNQIHKIEENAIYTRYADDMYISFYDASNANRFATIVEEQIGQRGFTLHPRKTRLQRSSGGRVIVTGIGVDEHRTHGTRKTKKKLRAAIHQKNIGSALGLREWLKLKPPKEEE